MINHQELREQYKPEKIKTLFIAESPPESDTFFYSAKSFFYLYTKQVFEIFFKDEINKVEFLDFFKTLGCYLDDLCHTPVTFSQIESNKESLIVGLRERLNLYRPEAVVITPKRIDTFVRKAINSPALRDYINLENIFTLYFPGNGWQNVYKSGLESALRSLIDNKILG